MMKHRSYIAPALLIYFGIFLVGPVSAHLEKDCLALLKEVYAQFNELGRSHDHAVLMQYVVETKYKDPELNTGHAAVTVIANPQGFIMESATVDIFQDLQAQFTIMKDRKQIIKTATDPEMFKRQAKQMLYQQDTLLDMATLESCRTIASTREDLYLSLSINGGTGQMAALRTMEYWLNSQQKQIKRLKLTFDASSELDHMIIQYQKIVPRYKDMRLDLPASRQIFGQAEELLSVYKDYAFIDITK